METASAETGPAVEQDASAAENGGPAAEPSAEAEAASEDEAKEESEQTSA
jgi:hypothetical protein